LTRCQPQQLLVVCGFDQRFTAGDAVLVGVEPDAVGRGRVAIEELCNKSNIYKLNYYTYF
jgi:hypothetical protein